MNNQEEPSRAAKPGISTQKKTTTTMTQEEMEARIEELEKENSELKQMLERINDNIDNVRKCIHEHERYTVELIHELDDKVYFINRDL